LIDTCKQIAKREVYSKRDVLSIELAGRRIIEDLLSIFWEGAQAAEPGMDFKGFPGKAYALMSSNYRNVFEKRLTDARNHRSVIPEKYFRVQLACDYVAGMTDTFAATLHRNLTYA
jgi:dGTPase